MGTGILDVFDRYNFTVNEAEPLEQEVAIDPEMLGKVFENLIEENLRHGIGAYYTPREIVHYMCQESLITYLFQAVNTVDLHLLNSPAEQEALFEDSKSVDADLGTTMHRQKVSREDLSILIRSGEQAAHYEAARKSSNMNYLAQLPTQIEMHAALIDVALRDITICDPAIGSGAFPVGMMSEIVKARSSLTPYFTNDKERTPYHFKRQAIQNCLYGVDIDRGAVEIAKLRLWLSLVVDEEELKDIKPLPNLDFKIVSGNSLLGFPFQSHGLTEIESLKVKYFDEPNHDRKAELKDKIEQRINAHVASSEKPLGYKIDFDFRLFFSEVFRYRGGFDIVLANPPYVRQEEIKDLKPFLKTYKCYSGMADLYVYFYERGFELLRAGGVLCFISSNKYFRARYGSKLREYLGSKGRVLQLIDFGDARVFEATAYPSIILVERPLVGTPSMNANVEAFSWEPGPPLQEFPAIFARKKFALLQSELRGDGWRLESPTLLRLLERIRSTGMTLQAYAQNRVYYGIKTGLNDAFVVDRGTRDRLIGEHPSARDLIKPFLRGRDVKRWRVEFADLYLIQIESSENKVHPWSGKSDTEAERIFAERYPSVHARFKQDYLQGLKKRDDQGKYFWELRSCVYWKEFEQPKIIIPAITDNVNYALDDRGYCSNDKTSIVIPPSLSYCLAIMNSQVSWWLTKQLFASKQGGFYEFKPMYFSQLPIPAANGEQQSLIETIAEYMTWLYDPQADNDDPKASSFFEQLLSGLVYELFFQHELHGQNLHLFKHVADAKPIRLSSVPASARREHLGAFNDKIADLKHPIRSCLFSLRSLEVVRIIEGEE